MRTYFEKLLKSARRSSHRGLLSRVSLTLALLPVLGMSVCDKTRSTPPKPTGPAAAVATTTYHGEGKIIATNPKFPSVEIDHQDIKDLMPAMTMEFYVKDVALLEGLNPGDRVSFTIENGVGGLKITAIKKL